MAENIITSRVRWTVTLSHDSLFVDVDGVDTYTQQHIQFKLPAHAVPALRDVLDDLIGTYPPAFRVAEVHRFK